MIRCLNMDQVDAAPSNRTGLSVQQTKIGWIEEIKAEDVNDCEFLVSRFSHSNTFDNDLNSHICTEFNETKFADTPVKIIRMDAGVDEIVKEEYQFNEQQNGLECEENFYINQQSNENIDQEDSSESFASAGQQQTPFQNQTNLFSGDNENSFSYGQKFRPITDEAEKGLNHINIEATSDMRESALKILENAIDLLKFCDFEPENQRIETVEKLNSSETLPNTSNSVANSELPPIDQSLQIRAPNMYDDSVARIEESSDSDMDSIVMIDLTSDHEEIERNIQMPLENVDHEADRATQPMDIQPKRKSVNVSKNRNTKSKCVNRRKRKKLHKCEFCHYSTTNKEHLTRHMRTHSNEKAYECKICTKRFVQSRTLAQHIKIHTRNMVSFRCSHCRREFSSEKAWKSHENKCKNGLRQYECFLCKVIAFNRNHLVKHMRSTHTGERNQCTKCRKKFISKLGFINHMKKHAKLFPFQCSKCRQVFSQKKKWQHHNNRCKVKQYKCKICGKIVENTNHLVYHMQMHTGKTFDCSKCSKQFRSKNGYESHKCQ